MLSRAQLRHAALTVAAFGAALAIEWHVAADGGALHFGPPGAGSGMISSHEHGRHLGGNDGAYDGATQTLSQIWNGDGGHWRLIVTSVLVLVLGSLAAGAGVGGGGLFVPIYWLILNVGPKGAVPLSKATILGGAVGNFLSLGFQRHPKANRPMIDYEASTFMQSGELLGVVFGVLLNKLLPAILIILFLIVILGWNAHRTIKKALQIRKKETKAFEKAAAAAQAKELKPDATSAAAGEGDKVDETPKSADKITPPSSTNGDSAHGAQASAEGVQVHVAPLNTRAPNISDVKAYGSFIDLSSSSKNLDLEKIANGCKPQEAAPAADVEAAKASADPEALQAILAQEAKQFPGWAWALLFAMTAFTMCHGFVSKIIARSSDCEEWAWWLWYITPVPVLGAFMWVTAIILGKRHKKKVAAGYEYLEADIQWTQETLKKFPVTALLAGVTAGLLGIGGGMVIGPLFLSIGMEPQVGTSSCAFMILWTAFSGVVAYGADDNLGAQLACACVGVGFISGQIGQRLVNTILKKTGRPSYVVFLLGAIIGTATVAMAAGMISKMVQGDYNADDVVEDGEKVFYIGSGFGCDSGYSNTTKYGNSTR